MVTFVQAFATMSLPCWLVECVLIWVRVQHSDKCNLVHLIASATDICHHQWTCSINFYTDFFQYFFVPCRKFGLPYLGKAQKPQEQRYPFLSVCVVFSCVQTMVWLPVFGIFNMLTDVDACDCTRGCTDTLRESTLEVDSGRKIPCCTRDLNLGQYCTWLFSQRMLYQLSYPCPNILLVICQSWLCCRASACEATWRSLFRLLAQNITWDVLIGWSYMTVTLQAFGTEYYLWCSDWLKLHDSHSSGFWHRILLVTFWLAEATWQSLFRLLAQNITCDVLIGWNCLSD